MGYRGFAYAPFAASKENEFGMVHKTLRSRASSMICWAEITLPSSRVRSEAFRTNLLNSALLGRRVMGTVSCSGLLFFGFESAGRQAALWPQASKTPTPVRARRLRAQISFRLAGWPQPQFGQPIHWSRDFSS